MTIVMDLATDDCSPFVLLMSHHFSGITAILFSFHEQVYMVTEGVGSLMVCVDKTGTTTRTLNVTLGGSKCYVCHP